MRPEQTILGLIREDDDDDEEEELLLNTIIEGHINGKISRERARLPHLEQIMKHTRQKGYEEMKIYAEKLEEWRIERLPASLPSDHKENEEEKRVRKTYIWIMLSPGHY